MCGCLGHSRIGVQRDRRPEHSRHDSAWNCQSRSSCRVNAREQEEVSSYAMDAPEGRTEARPGSQTGVELFQLLRHFTANDTQIWFAGAHSDVGGGYAKHELSDISLFWMAVSLFRLLCPSGRL